MDFLILFGVILLAITYWDSQREETDTVLLLEWWAWFDVSKEEHPTLFKTIIYIQTIIGIGMIVVGLLF